MTPLPWLRDVTGGHLEGVIVLMHQMEIVSPLMMMSFGLRIGVLVLVVVMIVVLVSASLAHRGVVVLSAKSFKLDRNNFG